MIPDMYHPAKRFLLPAMVLLFSASALVAAPTFDYDPLREYKSVSLKQLKETPTGFKSTNVKFKAYFHRLDDLWSPFYSPFDPDNYVSFSIWPVSNRLWVEDEVVKDFPFVYIDNENGDLETLLQANRYDVLQLKGTVKSAFDGYPWIAVRHIEVVKKKSFDEEHLRSLIRARQAENNDMPSKATKFYEQGLQYRNLYRTARAQVNRHLAINYYRSLEYKQAMDAVKAYRKHADEKDPLLERIYNKSRELLNMPKSERQDLERRKMEGETSSLDLLPDNRSLKKKYDTLLSTYEKVVQKNQSLQSKNDRLKQQLADALQSKAKMQARLHQLENTQKRTADAGVEKQRDTNSKARRPDTGTNPDVRDRLIRRIRSLKRRNRNLRSKVSSLNNRIPERQEGSPRHRETKSSVRSSDDRTTNRTDHQSTSSGDES